MTLHASPRIEVDKATGCWVWKRALDRAGYGVQRVDGRLLRAHRWLYEMLLGPVPNGMELDHLCRNRRCVNPSHLEPVTHAENARRGAKTVLTAYDRRKIVREMERLINAGHSQRAAALILSPRYAVARDYIRIVYREETKCRLTA